MDKKVPKIQALIRGLGLSALTLSSHYSYSAEVATIVGDDNHPPYSYIENGQNKGIYYEIVNRILAQMPDYPVQIELYPWKRALVIAQRANAEAIFPPHKFVAARPFLTAYSEPLLAEIVTVFCNADMFDKNVLAGVNSSNWVAQMSNRVFAISRGVKMGGESFWQAVANGEIKVVEVSGPKESLQMLQKRRAHCHINDQVTMDWYIQQAPENTNNPLLKLVDVNTSYSYLATSSAWPTDKQQAFLAEFNQHLTDMKHTGEVDKIIAHYFK